MIENLINKVKIFLLKKQLVVAFFTLVSLLGVYILLLLFVTSKDWIDRINSIFSFFGTLASISAFIFALYAYWRSDDVQKKTNEIIAENLKTSTDIAGLQGYIKKEVEEIKNSLYKKSNGIVAVIEALDKFFSKIDVNSEYDFFVMTDTSNIAFMHYELNQEVINNRDLRKVTRELPEKFVNIAKHSRESQMAFLEALDPNNSVLRKCYFDPLISTYNYSGPPDKIAKFFNEFKGGHDSVINNLNDCNTSDNIKCKIQQIELMPFQFFAIRSVTKKTNMVLIIFSGIQNAEQMKDAKAIYSNDPFLVDSLIGIYHTIENYKNNRIELIRKKVNNQS